MKAAGAGVAGAAVVGLSRLSSAPTVALVCGLLVLAVVAAVLVLLRQIIFAPDDGPASRLERILRVMLGRPETPTPPSPRSPGRQGPPSGTRGRRDA